MRMEPNGHLNVYQVVDEVETFFKDLLKDVKYGDCTYPTVCGNYGVCATENCTCPGENSTYFRRLNAAQANSGCVRIIPLSCQKTQSHTFLELKDVNYFRFVNVQHNIDIDSCKMQCLKNCSCEAAFFRYKDDNSSDDCSLQTEVLSLMEFDEKGSGYNAIAFIKVHTISSHRDILYLVLVFVSALVFLVIFAGACCYFGMLRKIRIAGGQKGDNSIDESLIHVTKLRFATNKFRIKLGGGGSGSVYEGCLQDGSKVAVKWLCSDMYQGRKLFLPEVETIGSIHHDNLIRLIGYCVERSNTLLVDEHMSNGSFDKWIFHQNQAVTLNWETRRKIIVGVTKGLEYLHNYCTKSIIHFDIKSQNFLVDKDFNVKISDFGLASLIDKDQTHISTVL